MSMQAEKLNLGCGEDLKAGYVNLDWQPQTGADVIHDLNCFPYPFPDDSFSRIEASHVLEHLDRPFSVMKELHRILRPGGTLAVRVPHFSRGFTHAEHAHGFDVSFPLYFNPRFTKSGYTGVSFELFRMRMRYLAFGHLLPFLGYGPVRIGFLKGVSAVISFLANANPFFASRIWCYWVGGFDEIEFIFMKKKP